MTQTITFPSDFTWGAATSSYQIEGAWDEDGRGESIWDRFCHEPGNILNGDTGDMACDHYHRWREDVQLMKDLGLQAYRFSIAWPRILPEGRGRVNQAGLDFYSRLVDGLLEAGIQPFVTLYHWDLPQTLQDEGGWPARSTAEAFVEYADVVSRNLGDRVKNWITQNEPAVVSLQGYMTGNHAPGIQDLSQALAASHHVLLSHGWAVPVLRGNSPGAQVGITLDINVHAPYSDSPKNLKASRLMDGLYSRWFLDPVYGRGYPADVVAYAIERGALPAEGTTFVQQGDLEAIAAPTDFLGLNYYRRDKYRAEYVFGSDQPLVDEQQFKEAGVEYTDIGWEVYPDGLYQTLCRLHFEYRAPQIYVTENGASYATGPDEEGRVPDQARLEYLREHFTAARRAIDVGVPLAGYFVWSLMDNFEWAYGYSQRFGIVWVDFETQERLPKDSAYWYSQVIAHNGFELDSE